MTDSPNARNADANPDPDGDALSSDRPRQRGIRAALVSVAPPEPSPTFWDGIEGALDEQDPLEIVTRPAVRSITEPPPISQPTLDDDPRHGLAAYRPSGGPRRPDLVKSRSLDDDEARRRRLAVVGIVVAVLAILGAGSVLGGGDSPVSPSLTPTTANPEAPVEPGQSAATNPPAIPGLDPAAPLTAAGIGPVHAGMTLGELQDAGATTTIEQSTFDGSGGTCFDASLPGAPDLTLRFRSPEAFVPVSDPREGILASINIEAGIGSTRLTETGIGLGATEEQLRVQPGLEVGDHPSRPGWFVYLAQADDGSGMAIAYVTDGSHVTEISVGEVEVVRRRQTCS